MQPPVQGSASAAVGQNIADILFNKGKIDADTLKKVKFEAINTGKPVEQVVVGGGYVSEKDIYQTKAEVYNMPFVDLSAMRIDIEVLNEIPQDVAQRNQAVAYEKTSNGLKVAMVDPLDLQKVRFLSTMIGKRVEPAFGDPTTIKGIIDTKYGAQIGTSVTEALEDVGEVVEVSGTIGSDVQGGITSAPVSRIVNMILEYAAKYKASDVHIEPRETRVVVRYRISGVLQEKLTLPPKLAGPIVSRIKILSNLKIDEHRVPQDGRFQIKVDADLIDLRVSIMPSVYGEKVVIRLLAKGGGTLTLDQTGLRGKNFQMFDEAIRQSQGILLVTGPTGSGKTQTLASALKIINKPEINIMTLEDPVEIRIDGITQVQVNADVGLTFAKGLRAFLRQDPDVILVGEIRDMETAELAVQASLTGHLVLATLHTNSAAGAIPRLKDMGIESFLLASTLELAAGQRLVRKICEHCTTSYIANEEQLAKLREVLDPIAGFSFDSLLQKNGGKINLYKGEGCPQCGDSGYKGRIGIFEVMKMTETLSNLTISTSSAQEIEKEAIKEGMITMMQDGFLKSLEGITTLEEVMRVVS
ncbi:MAG: Type II secretion system protein E [candidate division WS6 bacterium OLB20]|uniref:Type II secretion system protein E n=1 Tax=candidate division WS6 bacterium OLB20 TaxID=1617426 RepID=A0A136LY51_9BACT|nr:MAG: Type II secretion system protein E [candidate division WS6 bacterium OLB20]